MSQFGTLIFPNEALKNSFSEALISKNVRYFKLSIEDEEVVEIAKGLPTSSVVDDYNSLQVHFKDLEACYILFRFDMEDETSWALLRFVHERAQVRKKMLFSSTTDNVRNALGATNFHYSLNGVEKDQMSLKTFVEQNYSLLTPTVKTSLGPIVSAYRQEVAYDEKQREQKWREKVDHTEALTRAEQLQREEARLEVAESGSSTISFPVEDNVPDSLKKYLGGEINFIELSIVSEKLAVTNSSTIAPADIVKVADPTEPHFYLIKIPNPAGGQATFFVYSCPAGSKVRNRMSYSMGKGSTVALITHFGIKITKQIETQSVEHELTVNALTDQLSVVDPSSSPVPSSSPIELKVSGVVAGARPSQAKTYSRPARTTPSTTNIGIELKPAVKIGSK